MKNDTEKRLLKKDDIPESIILTQSEEAWFEAFEQESLPMPMFAATSYYLGLAENDPNDPIRKQCIPTVREFDIKSYELQDPLMEQTYSPTPRLIHRYPGRALLLVTSQCPVYCRHCFRRYFTGGGPDSKGPIEAAEISEAAGYVESHTEIKEILLSGGDPLMLPDDALCAVFESIRCKRADVLLRLCTRAPVTWPARITKELVSLCASYRPLWVSTHFNHPKEVTVESETACKTFIEAGIPMVNQTVLLRGINDNADTLETLFVSLTAIGVKPLYLFQGDLAPGTTHFRASLSKAFDIVEELEGRLSGLSMPIFALDLPDGGGKIRLSRSSVLRHEKGMYFFKNKEGKLFAYPDSVSAPGVW